MLSKKDEELIEAARAAIKGRYRDEWQEVGAALRTRDGRIVTGVNIDAYLGRMAICAEAIAIGRLITETGYRDRDDRGGSPPETEREGSDDRGGLAMRVLP